MSSPKPVRRRSSRAPRHPVAAVLVAVALALPGAAEAQGTATDRIPGEELLREASRLRDGGGFEEAATLVERYLSEAPGDAGAWWMLGQLRYWTGRGRPALVAYRRALELAPADPALRSDFAGVLVGLGHLTEARRVAEPVLDAPEPDVRGEAEAVLTTIRQLTAPWVLARSAGGGDNQPRTVLEGEAEVGVFATPEWTVAARLSPRYVAAGSGGTAVARVDALATTGWTTPGGRWGGRVGLGVAVAAGRSALLHSLRAGVRPARGVELWGRLDRSPYEWTIASLDSLVMSSKLEVALDAGDGPRWAGAVHWRRAMFDDDNAVTAVFGWALAPVAPGLRAGYAVGWQDASSSRWVEDPTGEPIRRPPGRADTIPGRYAPYYTPDDVVTHSLVVEASRRFGGVALRARGAHAVHATERTPVLESPPEGPVERSSYSRAFTPWDGAVSLTRALRPGAEIELGGEYRQTTWYRFGRVHVMVYARLR